MLPPLCFIEISLEQVLPPALSRSGPISLEHLHLKFHCSRLITFDIDPFSLHIKHPRPLLLLNLSLQYLEIDLQFIYHPCLIKLHSFQFIDCCLPPQNLLMNSSHPTPPPLSRDSDYERAILFALIFSSNPHSTAILSKATSVEY